MSTTSQAYQSRCKKLMIATDGNARNYDNPNCKCVLFTKRGGKKIGVMRCANRKLRAHNKNQCRAGRGKSFRAQRFVKCRK